jgi:hypothetical protein
MDYQKPAQGILQSNSLGNSKSYKISCECGDPNHELHVSIEADDTGILVYHTVCVQTK